jgi:twitching motility two-component system response regulator PilG
MIDSHLGFTEPERNILEYLKSQRLLQGNLDVHVKGVRRSGFLQVRKGQVIAAECGNLQGNGALLSLAAIGAGEVRGAKSEKPVESNVSVTVTQIERFFATLPSFPQDDSHCDEEQTLQDAIRLFFQFRRKEAGAKLVEVLRSNRFYYPAWLWHSRLMTREDYIKKALNEAKKWGNVDLSIKNEVQKIEPQFTGSAETVRRCIFCWSLIKPGEECCDNCGGMQRVSKNTGTGKFVTEEMQETLSLYEEEMIGNPQNSRIAYCLCLGFCSLGQIDVARKFIDKALKISPQEPLFIRASALLQPEQKPVRQEPEKQAPIQQVPVQQKNVHKEAPVVHGASPGESKIKVDKTILVVEDSKTARKVVSMVLGRKGYKIIEATSGTEALLAIEGITPDLVLLDVMLPDMTGYEVLSTIRKKSELSEVPVVMLTGKRSSADRLKGMVSGSNEYLTKPFDPAKLLDVLGKYLEPSVKTIKAPQPNYLKKVESSPPPVKLETAINPQVAQPAAVAQPTVAKSAVAQPTVAKPVVAQRVTAKPAVETPILVMPKKNGQERSVLVVEDSPTSRKVITMVLSRKGYVVYEAATGEEALRKVEEELPQLILLDAMLPDMTGYDILAQLKQDQQLKEIPVVMLTAKDSPVDREKGIRAGSVAYLTKPFNPDKLLSVIGSYI